MSKEYKIVDSSDLIKQIIIKQNIKTVSIPGAGLFDVPIDVDALSDQASGKKQPE